MQPLFLIHCITKIDSSHATLLDSPPFIQDASEMEMTVVVGGLSAQWQKSYGCLGTMEQQLWHGRGQ